MDSLTTRLYDALEGLVSAIETGQFPNIAQAFNLSKPVLADYRLLLSEEREKAESTPVGICPACKQTVFQSDDAVWTCPCDLSPTNPYWEPSDITDEEMERDGVYSKCYEDHGGWCSNHMPLHGECYEKGNY